MHKNEKIVPAENMPENVKSFVTVISSQYNGAIDKGWDKVNFEVVTDGKDITVRIESAEVGFVFDMGGTFYGIYNWKE